MLNLNFWYVIEIELNIFVVDFKTKAIILKRYFCNMITKTIKTNI